MTYKRPIHSIYLAGDGNSENECLLSNENRKIYLSVDEQWALVFNDGQEVARYNMKYVISVRFVEQLNK
jgi:hypothetical protein